jgi:hypothetical protein
MKTILLSIAVGASLLGISCKRNPEPAHFPVPQAQAAGSNTVALPGISPAVERSVREKGDAIAAEAFGVLSSRLGKAIADAGLTNAIEFCSVHGIAFTTAVGVTNRVVLRRVTHRPRNPQNRADTSEVTLIQRFEKESSQGTTSKPAVVVNSPETITYYAPIVLKLPLCLSCHGQPGTDIKPEVLANISKTYPNDEAKGFKPGEVRGLWRVDFRRSEFVQP